MRATLEFDLSDEEGRDELRVAMAGPSLSLAVSEVDEWLRKKIKYEDSGEAATEAYQVCREMLHEVVVARELDWVFEG